VKKAMIASHTLDFYTLIDSPSHQLCYNQDKPKAYSLASISLAVEFCPAKLTK